MDDAFAAITPAAIEWRGRTPFATGFADTYFSADDGIAESQAVFIDGNQLETRFNALPNDGLFVIGETGLGSGTNLLLAAAAFLKHAPENARLALLSTDLHPLGAADIEHALPPDLPLRQAFIDQYPALTPGFHRLHLHPRVHLTVMFGEALAMWTRQSAAVDAWFLDGFAPARNPAMWRPALMNELFRRSRPGATLATFTVAGAVRQTLSASGFELQRKPGFGRKRQRLEGRRPGAWTPQRYNNGRIVIAGAGLAGANTARSLAERGWQVEVWDPAGVAHAASGNTAGVTYTTPSGLTTPQNRWYQSSYLFALRRLMNFRAEQHGIARLGGVNQYIVSSRKRRKFDDAFESGLWPSTLLQRIDEKRVMLPGAGSVQPPAWCRWLLDHPSIELRPRRVDNLTIGADALALCVGGQTESLTALAALPLRRIRGQVTMCRMTRESGAQRETLCHDGYLSTAFDGIHCLGASFDPHSMSLSPRDADDAANVDRLRQFFPEHWQALGGNNIQVVGRRVAIRCQPHDYLPVVGALPGAKNESSIPAVINLAHGSRGITGTALAAEIVADQLSGLPLPVDPDLLAALSPLRLWAHPKPAPGRPSPPGATSR